MSTINFSVDVPNGAPKGTIDGVTGGYISTYIANDITSQGFQNNIIFCIQPDLGASLSSSTYDVVSGVSESGLNAQQAVALEGLFSHYWNGGSTSFVTQEETLLADWLIYKPTLSISDIHSLNGVSGSTIVATAKTLAADATAGDFAVDPNLQFTSFDSTSGHQNFVNISYDPVPLPASMGLFLTALVLLGGYAMKKKFVRN